MQMLEEHGPKELPLEAFDREVKEVETWNPPGKRTDLGSALAAIRDRYVHRNVPAVVVVTDGRANRGPDPEFTAARLDVPHVFVGTGDTSLSTRSPTSATPSPWR